MFRWRRIVIFPPIHIVIAHTLIIAWYKGNILDRRFAVGTNFYWYTPDKEEKQGEHIGKRSAAGPYCWDCGITLCKGGTREVHYDVGFFESCPHCGKERSEASKESALKELGFHRHGLTRRGVGSCSSFTWTMMGHLHRLKSMVMVEYAVVIDEYGNLFTADQLLAELEDCPIQTQYYGEFS
jgi:hypothetical protein